MKRIITVFFLAFLITTSATATTVTIESDNFTHLADMSNSYPAVHIYGTNTGWDLTGQLPLSADDIFPVVAYMSSISTKPLGNNVIGNPIAQPPPEYNLAPWEYWDNTNFLYLTVDGLIKDITVHSASRPGYVTKTFLIDLYTPDGVRVGHNFDTGTALTSHLVDYSAKYVLIYTSGQRSFDSITINYIPEPAMIFLLLLGFAFTRRATTRTATAGSR